MSVIQDIGNIPGSGFHVLLKNVLVNFYIYFDRLPIVNPAKNVSISGKLIKLGERFLQLRAENIIAYTIF